jgi:O-antigen/teichoic acid export membrane protein
LHKIRSQIVAFLGQLRSKRFQRLGRELFWISSGQTLTILGAIVGVRFLTGVLSPEIYGELSLGMTIAMLGSQVVFGPLAAAAVRFFAPSIEVGEFLYFSHALRRMMLKATGLVLLIACIACMCLLLKKQFNWLLLSIVALFFALFSCYGAILDGMQNAARQRVIVAWHSALASWGRFLMAAGLVVWLGANSAIAMLGYVLASIVVLSSQVWFFKNTYLANSNNEVGKEISSNNWDSKMFIYAWPFASWGLFTWAQSASDRWALMFFTSNYEVGLYSVLYQLGYYPVTIFGGLMVQLIAPIMYQRAGDASSALRMQQVYTVNWRLTSLLLFITFVAVVAAAALYNPLFHLLVAPEYQSVAWLLPWLVLSGGLFATGQSASLSLMSGSESRSLLAPKLVTAISGVLLNFVGAAWYGIIGVAGANLVFSIGYMSWMFYLLRAHNTQLIRLRVAEIQSNELLHQ